MAQILEIQKMRHFYIGRGRRTWSRLPPRVLLPSGERPAPTEAGAETGAAERHWRSLTPWHAVLEWMWESTSESGRGPELPSSPGQLPEEWCWFGAGDEELQVRQGNGDNSRNSFASPVGPAAQNHKEDGSSHYRPVGENQL